MENKQDNNIMQEIDSFDIKALEERIEFSSPIGSEVTPQWECTWFWEQASETVSPNLVSCRF